MQREKKKSQTNNSCCKSTTVEPAYTRKSWGDENSAACIDQAVVGMFRESIPKDDNIFLVCVFSVAAVFFLSLSSAASSEARPNFQFDEGNGTGPLAGGGSTDGGDHSTDHDSHGVKEANVRWWCQKPEMAAATAMAAAASSTSTITITTTISTR